ASAARPARARAARRSLSWTRRARSTSSRSRNSSARRFLWSGRTTTSSWPRSSRPPRSAAASPRRVARDSRRAAGGSATEAAASTGAARPTDAVTNRRLTPAGRPRRPRRRRPGARPTRAAGVAAGADAAAPVRAARRRDQEDDVAGLQRGPRAVEELLAAEAERGRVVRLAHLQRRLVRRGRVGPAAHEPVAPAVGEARGQLGPRLLPEQQRELIGDRLELLDEVVVVADCRGERGEEGERARIAH